MKKVFMTIIFLVFASSLFASNVSDKDVSNSFVAITDLGYIAASNFISFRRVDYDSIAIKMSEKNSLPEAVLFNNADLSTFLKYYKVSNSNNGFSYNFIPSIDPSVRERLILNDWKSSEAIVTGAAAIVFPNNMTFQKLISDGIEGRYPNVGVSFNFTVEGTLFSEAIKIKGILIFSSDQYGVPEISFIKLQVNDEDYDQTFFSRAPLLLTMKNDV